MTPQVAVPAGLRSLIAVAVEPLREARLLLLEPTPANVDRCGAALATAVPRVEAVRAAVAAIEPRDRGLVGVVAVLAQEVTACAALLESASRFHGELLQRMVDTTAGQTDPHLPLEG
jgi:hypothetical protein